MRFLNLDTYTLGKFICYTLIVCMDTYFDCMNCLNKNALLYHVLRSIHLHPPQIRRPRWQNVPYLEICKRATNAFVIHSNGSLLRCTSYPGVILIFKFFKLKFEFSTGAIWFEFFACTGQIHLFWPVYPASWYIHPTGFKMCVRYCFNLLRNILSGY